eukprot:7036707-Pyramimonas_sp.AAC.1
MEVGVLMSFFGARKQTYGTRQPRAAMLASVLFTCLGKVKGQPAPAPTVPDYSFYICLLTFTLALGVTIGFGMFMTLWAIMSQNNAIATEEIVAEAKAMGEHPGWGCRAIGRRRNVPATIPKD